MGGFQFDSRLKRNLDIRTDFFPGNIIETFRKKHDIHCFLIGIDPRSENDYFGFEKRCLEFELDIVQERVFLELRVGVQDA